MTHDEYLEHDALGLAARVADRSVTALELLELALERSEALNPALNAVVASMEDEARSRAAAPAGVPFGGVPFLAKDLVTGYAGHPTTGASRLLKDLPVTHDSELAVRTRAAGLVVFGKTNLPEWGLVPVTESELFGTCNNPWALDRTPGGSSGGSAAAVAAGIVPMASGGDGGGSIRIPASCCGLFGLKPTRGRTPTGPDYGLLWRGAVVEHVLTRSVRDSAAMLDATHGPDVGSPVQLPPPETPFLDEASSPPGRLRIAWTSAPLLGGEVHPDCVAAVTDAVGLLADMGHDIVESGVAVDGAEFARAFLTMVAGELAADFEEVTRMRGRRPTRGEVEPTTWALALLGKGIHAQAYASALRVLERTGRTVDALFQDHDLLLTPTLAAPPTRHGELTPSGTELALLRAVGALGSGTLVKLAGLLDQAAESAFSFTPWTPVFNATGHPAMSVPLHWNEAGLPIGVHFVGRQADEATLLRLAGQLEDARPWFDKLPELARSVG